MPSLGYASRRRREWATVAFGLICGTAFLAWSKTSDEHIRADKVVFSMSVADEGGEVLASPVVMSDPGQKVQVRLVCEDDPSVERMHVTLDPMGIEDGEMLYSYELSVAGHVQSQHGTVKLAMGKERKIRIRPSDNRGVTFTVFAEPLKKYMQRRKAHLRPVAS
jgi:hypothetical protein